MSDDIFSFRTSIQQQDDKLFSEQEVTSLLGGSETVAYKSDSQVFCIEEPNEKVYYLHKGRVKVFVVRPNGKTLTTAYIDGPSFLGAVNMLGTDVMVNSCMTVTDCRISSCSRESFLERARANGLMEKICTIVIGAYKHVYETLTAIIMEERIDLVDMLYNRHGLTQQETADMIGCSREHVARLCRQLMIKTDEKCND